MKLIVKLIIRLKHHRRIYIDGQLLLEAVECDQDVG